ncbi:MAG: tRNA (adenosine(37)-N6)-threonylcarbamoyltransferase complex dimerization subunit type 1 TsaB [Marinilabiliales bacterium]|nr:MAG: tRNA (adenosine(37)-N6)-threonylcarbamoyltransferase complex dimerization subunit type 1 TsaB [Marinilabiliales bacterium]
MALILNIETSTTVCSVCLSMNGELLGIKESSEEKSHAKKLTIFIDDLLKDRGYNFDNIDAVAISKGPGSYTGLRIGVSTAKGFCFAKNIPLIAVNTLQAMANGIINKIHSDELKIEHFKESILVPMIDARRMDVYSAFFNPKGVFVRDVKAEIIEEDSYTDVLNKKKMFFFGDGSEKIHDIIKHKNAFFIENVNPSSKDMLKLSEQAYKNKDFEDVAYFEPFYLKDFVATVPKKNIFK